MSAVSMRTVIVVVSRYPVVVVLLGNGSNGSGCLGLCMLMANVIRVLLLLLVVGLLLLLLMEP